MSPRPRAPWRLVFLSYPCPTCGVGPGEDCVTSGGNRKRDAVHADRARRGARCPRCGELTPADDEPGQLCARCELIRSLEIERSTYHQRET